MTSDNAGQFLCDMCAYEIYSKVDSGDIASGFFIHVPEKPPGATKEFAKKAGDLFGPKGDLDGDGKSNKIDPRPGKPEPRAESRPSGK